MSSDAVAGSPAVTEAGASLEEPLDAHNVSALKWWLLCRGIKLQSSSRKKQLVARLVLSPVKSLISRKAVQRHTPVLHSRISANSTEISRHTLRVRSPQPFTLTPPEYTEPCAMGRSSNTPMFSTELKGKVLQNGRGGGRGRDSGCDVTYNYRSGKCNQNTFALAKVVY